MIYDIACSLKHIHSLGLVHRGINPSAFRYDKKTGVVKLVSFGLCADPKNQEEKPEQFSKVLNAPEMQTGSFDSKADVWSLGILMHCLITALPPPIK
jgi:eukaryotic-like serine/threonine-protein kinase